MKVNGINAATNGNVGRLFKSIWFVVVTTGKAPTYEQVKMLCDTHGIADDDVFKLLGKFKNWNDNKKE